MTRLVLLLSLVSCLSVQLSVSCTSRRTERSGSVQKTPVKDQIRRRESISKTVRAADSAGPAHCPAFEPFRCPEENRCISIQYLCDGAPDCSDAYDEDPRLCTAARRPPVEETSSFLKSLLASHGPDYLEKLFGVKARNNQEGLGGVENVAIALSESQTIEDFGHTLKLSRPDIEHLRSVFMAVENGDIGMLKSLGIKDS